jgi:hypothetical protein
LLVVGCWYNFSPPKRKGAFAKIAEAPFSFLLKTNNQQPTTNNQQLTTNNQQLTTNNQQPTTNNQQPTTNNQQLIPFRPAGATGVGFPLVFACFGVDADGVQVAQEVHLGKMMAPGL